MNRKTGFNLIEIAIVLAVIGLVIGGIYVAASAVTENNRRQTSQKQLLQIVQNVRSLFATQSAYQDLDYTKIKALGLFPGDLQDTGTGYVSAYGGPVFLSSTANGNQLFQIWFSLSQGGCIDLLTKGFGSEQQIEQIGLREVGYSGGQGYIGAAVWDGISISEATVACSQGTTLNAIGFEFNLR